MGEPTNENDNCPPWLRTMGFTILEADNQADIFLKIEVSYVKMWVAHGDRFFGYE